MINAIAMFRVSLVCKATFVTDHTMIPHTCVEGAQWLIGRVPDSRPKGRGFEPHRRHCAVYLGKIH